MNKTIRKIVNTNCKRLEESKHTLADIYDITFSAGDCIMTESNDGYRITSHTYKEVHEMVEIAAEQLFAAIGASHSYVALEMENCVEWIVAFWAILRSGNKPYLVNCRHPSQCSIRTVSYLLQ